MKKNAAPNDPENFAAGLERLREIVSQLEQSDIGLEDGVRLYREACTCVKFCRKRLDEARIALEDESGALRDAEAFLAGEGAAAAVPKRSARGGRAARRPEEDFMSEEVPF